LHIRIVYAKMFLNQMVKKDVFGYGYHKKAAIIYSCFRIIEELWIENF